MNSEENTSELSSQKSTLRISKRDKDAYASTLQGAGDVVDRIQGAIAGDRNR